MQMRNRFWALSSSNYFYSASYDINQTRHNGVWNYPHLIASLNFYDM